MRSDAWSLLVIALGLLTVGCDRAPPVQSDYRVGILQEQLLTLRHRVDALEQQGFGEKGVVLPTSSKEWQWIAAGPSKARISISDVVAHRGGSKVTLSVRNPNAMALKECSANLQWYSTENDGTVAKGTMHERRARFDHEIAAATFSYHEFPLADLAPNDLDVVVVSGIQCAKTD